MKKTFLSYLFLFITSFNIGISASYLEKKKIEAKSSSDRLKYKAWNHFLIVKEKKEIVTDMQEVDFLTSSRASLKNVINISESDFRLVLPFFMVVEFFEEEKKNAIHFSFDSTPEEIINDHGYLQKIYRKKKEEIYNNDNMIFELDGKIYIFPVKDFTNKIIIPKIKMSLKEVLEAADENIESYELNVEELVSSEEIRDWKKEEIEITRRIKLSRERDKRLGIKRGGGGGGYMAVSAASSSSDSSGCIIL